MTDAIAKSKLKMNSYGQLYIYVNMGFATNMMRMTTRIFAEMNRNYSQMIEESPEHVKSEISKGSIYQKMLENMVQNKQE